MSGSEIAAHLAALVYAGAFLLLSMKRARQNGPPIWIFTRSARAQRLPALLFRLGFAESVLWPPFARGRSGKRRPGCWPASPAWGSR
ncbi:MAG: hypothetical protein J0I42_18735 [Bosea sp.]|uniref:hypothetical protein n=1 Tax=Bosea sp. (in: a-proteobacteria) TaxID=1871050 RepID=UPI001ACCE244|nr:hypothetical protein [Bosea sp. (in: a-proteobacteria)]MBN9453979.1 hypothetical protein [Bosea sp. (in: a-proteobacteria)]